MLKSSNVMGDIPLVEAAHYGGKQRPSVIVLRSSWTTDDKGAANGIAQAWHNPNNRVDSCHYVVDEATIIRCVPDNVVAFYGFPAHKGAISINVCYDPPEMPNPTTVSRAAKLTARLCKLYNLPVRILKADDEAQWLKYKWKRRGGIILRTSGSFPDDDFFYLVEMKG